MSQMNAVAETWSAAWVQPALTGTSVALAAAAAVPVRRWVQRGHWRADGDPPAPAVNAAVLAVVMAAGAAVAGWATLRPGWWPAGVAGLVYLVAAAGGSMTDLAARRIPEANVLLVQGTLVALLLLGALITGQWADVARATLAGAAVWAATFLIALSGALSFGDVQMIGTAALVMGWISWTALAITVGGIIVASGLWATVLYTRGRRGSFAMAPSIALGVLLGMVLTALAGPDPLANFLASALAGNLAGVAGGPS